MELKKELIELSQRVEDYYKINSISNINSTLELSDEMSLPYTFSCEALHPGTFKGFDIPEEEIIKSKHTIFNSTGNLSNNEINKDHKGNRKNESSVDDVVGRVTGADYNYDKKAYILTGEVYDKELALKIHNKIIKFVSLRINPGFVERFGERQIARDLSFEELSFVRLPGDPDAKIN